MKKFVIIILFSISCFIVNAQKEFARFENGLYIAQPSQTTTNMYVNQQGNILPITLATMFNDLENCKSDSLKKSLQYLISISNAPNKVDGVIQYPYWFLFDNIPYVLTYEPINNMFWNNIWSVSKINERNVYLYKFENNYWVKAISNSIMSHKMIRDTKNADQFIELTSLRQYSENEYNSDVFRIARPNNKSDIVCVYVRIAEKYLSNSHTEIILFMPTENGMIAKVINDDIIGGGVWYQNPNKPCSVKNESIFDLNLISENGDKKIIHIVIDDVINKIRVVNE